jgi:hypothetical protein
LIELCLFVNDHRKADLMMPKMGFEGFVRLEMSSKWTRS